MFASLSLLVGLAAAGCGRGDGGEGAGPGPEVPVAILQPEHGADPGAAFQRLARSAFRDAREVRVDALRSKAPALLADGTVIVVPAAGALSPAGWMVVERYAVEGGAVLLWGTGAKVDLMDEERRLPANLRHRYTTTAMTLRREAPWDESAPPTAGGSVDCLFPGPGGAGGAAAPGIRAIPLAVAEGAGRIPRGAPGVMILDASREGTLRRWAYLGIDPAEGREPLLIALLRDAAVRLARGRHILRCGVDRYAFEPGDALDALVEITGGAGTSDVLRVVGEMLDAEGRVTRRVGSTIGPGVSTRLSLGNLPRDVALATDFTLRTTLWDAQEKTLLDRVDQNIRLLPSRRTPASEPPTVLGLSILTGRRAIVPYGFHYAPAGFDPAPRDGEPHWLDPGWFSPEAVRRDLDRMWEIGVNAVGLSIRSASHVPQLLHVLEDLRSRNLWACLFVEGLQSTDPGAIRAAIGLLSTPRLAADDTILFVADRAASGARSTPRDMDRNPAWRRWLAEQFGSASAARDLFGGDGASGPEAAASWRRFRADSTSRLQGYVRRSLRDAGMRALLGFVMDPDAAPESGGVVHADLVLASFDERTRDSGDPVDIAMLSALARGVSAGKPVFWLDAGASAATGRAALDVNQQAVRLEAQLTALARGHAAGILFARFSARAGRMEDDLAVCAPDGSWRPVGDVVRGLGGRLRRDVAPPLPWRGREIDAATLARGRAGLGENWRDVFAREIEQGAAEEWRVEGFGDASTEARRVTVYGLPVQGPAPLLMLNAEWGRVNGSNRFPGDAVQVAARKPSTFELVNTGPARWITGRESQPGTIWVRAAHENGQEQMISVPAVVHGGTVAIRWTPGDTGRWRLRPYWMGVGGFGESLDVRTGP